MNEQLTKGITAKHGKELQEFGEKIDVLVSIYMNGTGPLAGLQFDGEVYVTFRDDHATDFPTAVKKLRHIQETEFPQDHGFLVY